MKPKSLPIHRTKRPAYSLVHPPMPALMYDGIAELSTRVSSAPTSYSGAECRPRASDTSRSAYPETARDAQWFAGEEDSTIHLRIVAPISSLFRSSVWHRLCSIHAAPSRTLVLYCQQMLVSHASVRHENRQSARWPVDLDVCEAGSANGFHKRGIKRGL